MLTFQRRLGGLLPCVSHTCGDRAGVRAGRAWGSRTRLAEGDASKVLCAQPPQCRRAGRSSASGPGAFRGRARRLGPWAPRPAPALPSHARVGPLDAGGHYRGGRGPPAAARSWPGRASPHSGEAPEQAARLRPPQERRTQRSASSPDPSKMTIKRRRVENIAQVSTGTQEQAVRHGC